MLDVANSKPPSPDSAPIIYIQSPAAPLGVESAAFDFVVCQQGLQFFPDRLAALSEMRRALKPGGGQLAVAAWSHIEVNAFYAALHAALRESVPGDLADRLLAPFSWPDAQVLKDTVEAAGFHEIRVRSAALPLIFEGGRCTSWGRKGGRQPDFEYRHRAHVRSSRDFLLRCMSPEMALNGHPNALIRYPLLGAKRI
jgi:SAM-dependent methyltransferase